MAESTVVDLQIELGVRNREIKELQTVNQALLEANKSVYELFKLSELDKGLYNDSTTRYERDNEGLKKEVANLKGELAYAQKRIIQLQNSNVQVVDIEKVAIEKAEGSLQKAEEIMKVMEENGSSLREANLDLQKQLIEREGVNERLAKEVKRLEKLQEKPAETVVPPPKPSFVKRTWDWLRAPSQRHQR